jgi:hypothetical protein
MKIKKRNAGIFCEFTFIKIKLPSNDFQVETLSKTDGARGQTSRLFS